MRRNVENLCTVPDGCDRVRTTHSLSSRSLANCSKWTLAKYLAKSSNMARRRLGASSCTDTISACKVSSASFIPFLLISNPFKKARTVRCSSCASKRGLVRIGDAHEETDSSTYNQATYVQTSARAHHLAHTLPSAPESPLLSTHFSVNAFPINAPKTVVPRSETRRICPKGRRPTCRGM